MNSDKICTMCINALLEDNGYSNYTVEGTDFSCKLNLHPDGTFDRFYNDDGRLKFAEKCISFVEGEAEFHNVDCPYDCSCEGTIYDRKTQND
jgi:hypothetical protein